MTITTQEDGFTRIEACGLTIIVPTTDDTGADDRAEIRCNGWRVNVEAHDGGVLVGKCEPFADYASK